MGDEYKIDEIDKPGKLIARSGVVLFPWVEIWKPQESWKNAKVTGVLHILVGLRIILVEYLSFYFVM